MDICEIINWGLSCIGGSGALFTLWINRNVNQQKHELDLLKIRFDHIIQRRNHVVAVVNQQVSEIELWRKRLKDLESAEEIDITYFHKLLLKFERVLVHGQYLLSSDLNKALEELYEALNQCYEKSCEDSLSAIPEEIFSTAIFEKMVEDKIKSAKYRLSQEIGSDKLFINQNL